MKYDVVLLTDSRYLTPKEDNIYVSNVIWEDQLVMDALQNEGLSVVRKSWDDQKFDWGTCRFALFRATWDYFDRFNEFFEWFQKTKEKTRFINSTTLIQWNIDKHYLQNLEVKGINIPATLFIEKASNLTLKEAIQKAKDQLSFSKDELILKPCVAGGARHTYKFKISKAQELESTFQELIAEEAMMLQEFQVNIVSEGEMSLMLFEGKYSHAVLKIAKPGDFRVQDDYGGSVHNYEPSTEEIEFAKKVVEACPELPTYARVDIFKDNHGKWALAELEIFEPELWFRNRPDAASVLAHIIKSKVTYEEVS
ncbi:ATP-grasp domain-containing protein [Flagellimonas sp.]|uniref:ATP-grasp domain-containing protein n=1 Tax=Flagellimonas sp. TaxID=2058762 RepID=UPI003F4A5CBD